MNSGYVLVALSFLFLVIGGYAILFSAFLPLSGVAVRTSDVVISNASSGRQVLDALEQVLEVRRWHCACSVT